MGVATEPSEKPSDTTSLAWWEEFDSTIVIARAVEWVVRILCLCSLLGIGLLVYRFSQDHWHLWSQKFQEERVRTALHGAVVLGWDVLYRLAVFFGIRIAGGVFVRLPIPDRLLIGWAKDPDMRPTTAAWLVNEFRWSHRLTVAAVLRAHFLGKTEARGNALIQGRAGVKALSVLSLQQGRERK